MSLLAPSAAFEYLCYGSKDILHFLILSVGGLISESDVHRRQILKSKDGPRIEIVQVDCIILYGGQLHNILTGSIVKQDLSQSYEPPMIRS